MNYFQYPYDLSAEITLTQQGAAIVELETRQSQDAFLSYNQFRAGFIYVSAIIPLFLLGFGIVIAYLNWRFFSIGLVVLITIWMMLIWITFAIHLTANEGVDDICNEINTAQNTTSTYMLESSLFALSQIIPCDPNLFSDLTLSLSNVLNSTINLGCQGINQLCTMPNVIQYNSQNQVGDCTTLPSCSLNLLQDYVGGNRGSFTFYDVTYQCNVSGQPNQTVNNVNQCDIPSQFLVLSEIQTNLTNCPLTCQNSLLRSITSQLITTTNYAISFNQALNEEIYPLLDCNFVIQAFSSTKQIVCVDFDNELVLISAGTIIGGFVLMAATIIFMLGWKRFRRL